MEQADLFMPTLHGLGSFIAILRFLSFNGAVSVAVDFILSALHFDIIGIELFYWVEDGEMISAAEIRIGNLFINDGKIICVDGIRTFRLDIKPKIYFHLETESMFDIDELEPIPLTEERLEGFGFKDGKIEIKLPHPKWHTEGVLTVLKDGICSLLDYTFESEIELNKIQYVHELQNLYHALTGEELKIK